MIPYVSAKPAASIFSEIDFRDDGYGNLPQKPIKITSKYGVMSQKNNFVK
jgi:hypothetical protein